ncbi:LrgB family protein [Falsirhodobacter sp. alg1]|uniref:LrgB family protein n=1 Tax=Falsirhodobacter sp. alg1 TaxID=1472418 RepID=UPI00192D03C7|nr:LrgB family protein [Falsirhodobacter sp. alg1]
MAASLWAAVGGSAPFWICVTLGCYMVATTLSNAAGRHPLVNPVLITVLMVMGSLLATGTDYQTYADGTHIITFLLGPATVALALPIRDNLHHVRAALLPLAAALIAGSCTAAVTAVGFAYMFGLDGTVLASLAPKSATAPVAIAVSQTLGGIPTLTAGMVIVTGVTGAIVVTPLMTLLRITDWRAHGFATGVAAHGVGTARALQINPIAGAFAGLGMGLNAIATGFVAPWALGLFQ